MRWQDLRQSEALRLVLRRRALFIDVLRSFFKERGFLEVETPYLQRFPNLDANVEPFEVDGLWLHTSPEYGMKKLLAAGFDRIFQICRVFRRETPGPLHLQEFDMLEWYERGRGYMWLVEFTFELLMAIADALGYRGFRFRDREATLKDYALVSLEEEFVRRFGVSIGELSGIDEIVKLARILGVPFDERSWDNTFNLIFLNLIEPEIARVDVPVFVVDYPAPMAAMARLRRDKPYLCERVELFICGVEVANGYGELSDSEVQRERLLKEAENRGLEPCDAVDEDFLSALPFMGEAAGCALGVDRLFMLFEGLDALDGCVFEG